MQLKKKTFAFILIVSFLIPFGIQIENIRADDIPPLDIHLSWQHDTTTTMTITWRTTESASSIVQYGLDSAYGNEKDGEITGIYHFVELTGLLPETIYHYRVGDGTSWSGDYSFKTGTSGNHIQFIDVGDCQNRPVEGRMMQDAIRRLPMDMLTFTGDLCNTGPTIEEWYNWFTAFSPLIRNVPLMNILGNHERNLSYYYDMFSLPGKEEYYSFNLGPVHFVGLHTLWNGAPNNLPEQAAWLISDLESHQEYDWTIVMMHTPPFSSFPRYYSGEYDSLNETFVPIFEQYSVDLVMTGHEHAYERLQKNNVTYVISGGGGSRLVDINTAISINESIIIESSYNFLYLDIYENKLSVGGYRPDYSLIDQHVVNMENKADLSFVSLPITFTEKWNETLELPIIITNTGEESTPTLIQAEYTTHEGTFSFEVPPLAVNEKFTYNVSFSVPSSGIFTIEFDLDTTEIVDEVVEENNVLVITFNALALTVSKTSFLSNGLWGIIAIFSALVMVSVLFIKRKNK
ncbi:MAG: fibronectin type III domain-containing protein [Candidatus Heimdallarchaeota archaeon]|nr:fibronectin type III domain-containing protein [Candidatus Heimdallarchaeota archaeon]MCK5143518.1 fibronectin type III domain-containing protein [Candidatus Heimdallarchaeota archaeon]